MADEQSEVRAVPASEIPMQWVTDADTPEPYLINICDFEPEKHTALVARKRAKAAS